MFQNVAKLRTAVISVSKPETVTTPPQGYIVFHGKIVTFSVDKRTQVIFYACK